MDEWTVLGPGVRVPNARCLSCRGTGPYSSSVTCLSQVTTRPFSSASCTATWVIADLTRQVAGRQPEDLVFSGIRNGGVLRVTTFRTAFAAAARAIGLPGLHPHELRHTAASLAIASGADVKVVQQMLGHGSATMTLDTYGHLFADRLDEVADAMDSACSGALKSATASPAVAQTDSAAAQRCPGPIRARTAKTP